MHGTFVQGNDCPPVPVPAAGRNLASSLIHLLLARHTEDIHIYRACISLREIRNLNSITPIHIQLNISNFASLQSPGGLKGIPSSYINTYFIRSSGQAFSTQSRLQNPKTIAEMSERLPNSWTDFLSNEAPIDEFIPNIFHEMDDIDILLHYSPIQSSTGSSIDYPPFGYSSRSSSALFQEIGTHPLTNSPHTSIQDWPYTSIQDSPRTSIQDSPRTSIQDSPPGLEHFTPGSSPPPPVPAISNDSHLSLKYRCNIRGCRNRSGFTSLKSRLVHARKVHKTHFFCSCPECPWVHTYRSFPTKEALDEHWRVSHPNVNHFRCSECSYTTDNVTNIQLKHLNVHFKEEGDISEAMVRIRQEKEARRGRRRGQTESD